MSSPLSPSISRTGQTHDITFHKYFYFNPRNIPQATIFILVKQSLDCLQFSSRGFFTFPLPCVSKPTPCGKLRGQIASPPSAPLLQHPCGHVLAHQSPCLPSHFLCNFTAKNNIRHFCKLRKMGPCFFLLIPQHYSWCLVGTQGDLAASVSRY